MPDGRHVGSQVIVTVDALSLFTEKPIRPRTAAGLDLNRHRPRSLWVARNYVDASAVTGTPSAVRRKTSLHPFGGWNHRSFGRPRLGDLVTLMTLPICRALSERPSSPDNEVAKFSRLVDPAGVTPRPPYTQWIYSLDRAPPPPILLSCAQAHTTDQGRAKAAPRPSTRRPQCPLRY